MNLLAAAWRFDAFAAKHVRGMVIISAGFHEAGPAGAALEHEVLVQARRGRMRIVGPNCLGMMSPLTGLNATFAPRALPPGRIVGWWPDSGHLVKVEVDQLALADHCGIDRMARRPRGIGWRC